MTSTPLRPAVAAAVLTLLLGLCAMPAAAEPPLRAAAPPQTERALLPQLWSWLNELLTSGRTPSRMLENSREEPTAVDGSGPSGGVQLSRTGIMDPNG